MHLGALHVSFRVHRASWCVDVFWGFGKRFCKGSLVEDGGGSGGGLNSVFFSRRHHNL